MENSNNTVKLIGALLAGALVGAAVGILFAPDKGSKTRSKIVGGAKDLAENLKIKLKNEAAYLRKQAEDLEDLAEEKMEEVFENIKQKTEEKKQSK